MPKLFFIYGFLLSNFVFAQEKRNYLIKFYDQLQSSKFCDLNNIIASRADSQRFNLLASNFNPQINFGDGVTIDKKPISKNYADEKSISDFKEKIKATIIKKIIFKTIPLRIGEHIIWETYIDISTKPTSDSIVHYSDTGIWLKIPAFVSYKCFVIDPNGKFVKEILSHPAFHYPMTIRNMTKDDIGADNILVLYFFDDKIIQLIFYKL